MKKTNLALIIFLTLIPLVGSSQNNTSSLSLLGGFIGEKSIGGMILYKYTENKNVFEFGVYRNQFSDNSYKNINYSITGMQVGYAFNAFSSKYNSLVFDLGGGLTGGMQKIINPENYPLVSKDGFEYGVYVTLGLDIYVSDKLSLILRSQENYSMNSGTGKFNPFLGGGIKYNF